MERRDVANKSDPGRLQLAQQRMQQTPSANSAGSHNLVDANSRGSSHIGATSENQVHQGSQTVGSASSHDGGNSQGQEPERTAAAEGNVNNTQDQPPQNPTVADGAHIPLRRNGGLGWAASVASAFDAAKDIMEALRNKHQNLAGELEVRDNCPWFT